MKITSKEFSHLMGAKVEGISGDELGLWFYDLKEIILRKQDGEKVTLKIQKELKDG